MTSSTTIGARRRRRVLASTLAVGALLLGLGPTGTPANAKDGPTTSPTVTPTGPGTRFSGPSPVPFADPDTIATGTRYVTYGTSTPLGRGPCGVSTWGARFFVPYMVHGAGESVSFGSCTAADSGDAMPDGPGAWADPNTDVWAPSVVQHGGRFILFYTATKRGTGNPGHKCIGKAYASSARGPFKDAGEFACPGGGRWALDPDAFVDGGQLYVVYRDDAVNGFPETGLSVVRTDANGVGIWSTRRTLLYSTDLSWESKDSVNRTIENPTMMKVGNGRWHLFFSGNDWDTRRYSTGVADCGTSPLSAGRCVQHWGQDRPYWGYSASSTNPHATLPQNRLGPGGMSMFRTFGGQARVVWHYIENENPNPPRRALIGELKYSNGLFWVE
jgi:arabinan endo-1,5-alpha-L-arabinosidase